MLKIKGNKKQNMKTWLADSHKLMDLLRITSNPSSFDQDEKNFDFDQQSLARKMAVSKDVDQEHVKKVAEQ